MKNKSVYYFDWKENTTLDLNHVSDPPRNLAATNRDVKTCWKRGFCTRLIWYLYWYFGSKHDTGIWFRPRGIVSILKKGQNVSFNSNEPMRSVSVWHQFRCRKWEYMKSPDLDLWFWVLSVCWVYESWQAPLSIDAKQCIHWAN